VRQHVVIGYNGAGPYLCDLELAPPALIWRALSVRLCASDPAPPETFLKT